MDQLISYAHKAAPDGDRYVQLKDDPVPVWAVNIRDEEAAPANSVASIHDDVREILSDNVQAHGEFAPELLQRINTMLQYAWNRGYKAAYQDKEI